MRRKIAYCIESFHNSGGMERILSVCANLLVEHHLITLIIANQCNKPYAYELSENIQVVDLHIGLKDYKLQYQKVLSEYLLNCLKLKIKVKRLCGFILPLMFPICF